MTWQDLELVLAEAAHSGRPLAGHYHDNLAVDRSPVGPVLVRRRRQADEMDLRAWDEDRLLRALRPYMRVPRVWHCAVSCSVHELIVGDLVAALAPQDTDDQLAMDLLQLLVQVIAVPIEPLPDGPSWWPCSRDVEGFGRLLQRTSRGILANTAGRYGTLFKGLGFPFDPDTVIAGNSGPKARDPFAVLGDWPATLTPRTWTLIHGDIHKANVISTAEGLVLVDWELALAGADPLYELAAHLTRMRYAADQAERVFQAWAEAVPPGCSRGAELDLPTYLRHECIKSTLVDSVRFADAVAEGRQPVEQAADRLEHTLTAAAAIWQIDPPEPSQVVEALDHWQEIALRNACRAAGRSTLA